MGKNFIKCVWYSYIDVCGCGLQIGLLDFVYIWCDAYDSTFNQFESIRCSGLSTVVTLSPFILFLSCLDQPGWYDLFRITYYLILMTSSLFCCLCVWLVCSRVHDDVSL